MPRLKCLYEFSRNANNAIFLCICIYFKDLEWFSLIFYCLKAGFILCPGDKLVVPDLTTRDCKYCWWLLLRRFETNRVLGTEFQLYDLYISETPFATHSGGERAKHSAMAHPLKRTKQKYWHHMNGFLTPPPAAVWSEREDSYDYWSALWLGTGVSILFWME